MDITFLDILNCVGMFFGAAGLIFGPLSASFMRFRAFVLVIRFFKEAA